MISRISASSSSGAIGVGSLTGWSSPRSRMTASRSVSGGRAPRSRRAASCSLGSLMVPPISRRRKASRRGSSSRPVMP